MSELEILTLLHKAQMLSIEIAGTLSFFVVLLEVLCKHLGLPGAIFRLASFWKRLTELMSARKNPKRLGPPSRIRTLNHRRRKTKVSTVTAASGDRRTSKRKTNSPRAASKTSKPGTPKRKSNVLSKACTTNIARKQSRDETTPRDDGKLFDF